MTPQQKEQAQPPRVSVVIVSHNRVERLRRCLDSVEKSEERDRLQVIVVDNGSLDGSAQLEDEFPKVQFVRLPKNFGLTKALNIGWRAADAEYAFFLHDDTQVSPGTIPRLAETLDQRADAAAACPLLTDAQGRPAPQLGNLPPDGTWSAVKLPADEAASGEPIAVPYARGAALMMRVFLIKAIRQIDERYGQFGSDADLAEQIRRGSKKVLVVPQATARHFGRGAYTTHERADFLLGRAVFLGKYQGFGAGLQARIAAVLGALFSFRFGELKYTVAGQKIDGTQS